MKLYVLLKILSPNKNCLNNILLISAPAQNLTVMRISLCEGQCTSWSYDCDPQSKEYRPQWTSSPNLLGGVCHSAAWRTQITPRRSTNNYKLTEDEYRCQRKQETKDSMLSPLPPRILPLSSASWVMNKIHSTIGVCSLLWNTSLNPFCVLKSMWIHWNAFLLTSDPKYYERQF